MGFWDTLRGALSRSSPTLSVTVPPPSTYKVGRVVEKVNPGALVLLDGDDSFHYIARVTALFSDEELEASFAGERRRLAHGEPLADDLEPGDLLEADREEIGRYLPGRLTGRREELLKILFGDGQEREVPAERVRLSRIHPDILREQRWVPKELQPGDRLLAAFGFDPFWYTGTVAMLRGDEVRVHFDDGAQSWLSRANLAEEDLRVGDFILADRAGKRLYLHAIIAERRGERLRVRYRDGLEEWLPIGRARVVIHEQTELTPLTIHPG
jgi:hypothetical protein